MGWARKDWKGDKHKPGEPDVCSSFPPGCTRANSGSWAEGGHWKMDYKVYSPSSTLSGFVLVSHSNKVSFTFLHAAGMLLPTHRMRHWTDGGEPCSCPREPKALLVKVRPWAGHAPTQDWFERLRCDLPRAGGGERRAGMSERSSFRVDGFAGDGPRETVGGKPQKQTHTFWVHGMTISPLRHQQKHFRVMDNHAFKKRKAIARRTQVRKESSAALGWEIGRIRIHGCVRRVVPCLYNFTIYRLMHLNMCG